MVSTSSLTLSELDNPSSENKGKPCLSEIASAPPKTKKHSCSLSYHGLLSQMSLLLEDSKPKSQVLHFPKHLTTQNFFPVSASEITPSPFPHSGAQGSNPVRKVPSLLSFTFLQVFRRPCPPGLARPVLH